MRTKMMTAAFLMLAMEVNAQEVQDTLHLNEVVVTGTKFEIPVEKSGKTIYKLNREDIEKNAGKSLADLLNEVPGMEMNGAHATPGSNISYSLRGARTNNILVLIDGVPLNDPSKITAFYDLRFLPLAQIESIEVLNGGLSTLYGTGASAGVINIQLKKPSTESFEARVDVNGGSYGFFQQNLNLSGSSAGFSYALLLNNSQSEGFSAASESAPTDDFDKDGFTRKNGMVRLGYTWNDNFNVKIMSAYNLMDAEYDAAAYMDADNDLKSDELRFGIKPTFSYDKGSISLHAVYNINHNDFQDAFPAVYEGRSLQADLIHEHQFTDALKTLVGINAQRATYAQEDVFTFSNNYFLIIDPYASLLYESNFGFNLHVGTRVNNHSEYGSHFIYNINPSYIFDVTEGMQVKLRQSISTAFVTPSLYQLHSSYGNINLEPEQSVNYDVGVSLYMSQALSFNATYYIREEKEVIDFVSRFDEENNFIGGAYDNLQETREIRGFELQMEWAVVDELNVNAYLSQIDKNKSTPFYRIPENKWGFGIGWQPVEAGNLSVKYKKTGERRDIDFMAGGDVVLDSYEVVDIYVDYLLFGKLKVYGAINNLFDEEFVNTWGFNTKGRNYNIGMSYQF